MRQTSIEHLSRVGRQRATGLAATNAALSTDRTHVLVLLSECQPAEGRRMAAFQAGSLRPRAARALDCASRSGPGARLAKERTQSPSSGRVCRRGVASQADHHRVDACGEAHPNPSRSQRHRLRQITLGQASALSSKRVTRARSKIKDALLRTELRGDIAHQGYLWRVCGRSTPRQRS